MTICEERGSFGAPLARHYSRFAVSERLLLTGHSHQAWPDCAFDAQQRAWLDAAELVDRKWERAFAVASRVRDGFARLMEDREGHIALGPSTHDMVIRFLSALPLAARPRIVTTDGEFHSLRRQLDRLAEAGIEIVRIPAAPERTVGERLAAAVDDRTAAVAASYVFFKTGRLAGDLRPLTSACDRHGAALLIDAYHALNVVPFSVPDLGLANAFVVGGGYKYCQLGEGNCFLRFPPDCAMRPIVTGWFAEFDVIADSGAAPLVPYGDGPGRFAGSTYDPASHYRAAEVFDFFRRQGLTVASLRAESQRQIGLLAKAFDDLDLSENMARRDRAAPLEEIGGFLVIESPVAGDLCDRLAKMGVRADSRGTSLRLGPAPYLTDSQLFDAMSRLRDAVNLLS